ncbi:MAG: hypothetical protein CSA72_13020 [Rhodobacterales bacterium]|nr:MAG: hypothetical protein CSA72_13020 [Rhodobacterales bacterium]
MADDPLFLLVLLSCGAVAIILMFGIGTFGKGGEFNRRHANRIMRWRIIGQAIAIALILLFVWLRSKGGA